MTMYKNHVNTNESIREVYSDNFVNEMKQLRALVEDYPYIALDTEFPGFPNKSKTCDDIYDTIRSNVNPFKIIQAGFTLFDKNGKSPQPTSTWQFNFKYDIKTDRFSNASMKMLVNSGINFDLHQRRGITMECFGEYLMTSGLVLNDNVHWISFQGSYDFAYVLKILTNQPLPDIEEEFFEELNIYFINYYDIRYILRNNEYYTLSLQRIANALDIVRIGTQHQAGSDSMLTGDIFFRLKKIFIGDYLNDKNVLYGIGEGFDENHYNYYSSLSTDNYGESINFSKGFNQQINTNYVHSVNYQLNRVPAFPIYNTISSNIYKTSMQNSVQCQNENKTNSIHSSNSLNDYTNIKKKKIILKNVVS